MITTQIQLALTEKIWLSNQLCSYLHLGAVLIQKILVSDIFPQNASDAKHAVGAGGGDCLDLLLHPGGWRQALHPLKDVPQGDNQIFWIAVLFHRPMICFRIWQVDDQSIFVRISLGRLCWSLGEVLALEDSCVSSQYPSSSASYWIMIMVIIVIFNHYQHHLESWSWWSSSSWIIIIISIILNRDHGWYMMSLALHLKTIHALSLIFWGGHSKSPRFAEMGAKVVTWDINSAGNQVLWVTIGQQVKNWGS